MAKIQSLHVAPQISALARYEFQQAVWFDVWRRANGHSTGLSETDAHSGLAAFDLDLTGSVWNLAHPDWESIVLQAERLALDHTPRDGARAMDILHVATALHIGATEFLTFDTNQRRLAEAVGLTVNV